MSWRFIYFLSLFFLKGQTIDDIPSAVIEDAAQLVKANSIEGCKRNNIDVVYTMWENLKKTPAMDVGQVSFHRDKDVRKIRVEKKINEIVNRLNKTKIETSPGKMLDRNDQSEFVATTNEIKRFTFFCFVFHCRFPWRAWKTWC